MTVDVTTTRLDLGGLLTDPAAERVASTAAGDSALRLLKGPGSLLPVITGRSARGWQTTIATGGSVLAFFNRVRYAPPLELGHFAHGSHKGKAQRTVARGIPGIQQAAATALGRDLEQRASRYITTTTRTV